VPGRFHLPRSPLAIVCPSKSADSTRVGGQTRRKERSGVVQDVLASLVAIGGETC
jgi:hypothetical protein